MRTENENGLLFRAAQERDLSTFKKLLEAKTDPNFLVNENSFLAYLMREHTSTEYIDLVIQHGAKVDGSVGNGENSMLLFFLKNVNLGHCSTPSKFTSLLLGNPDLGKILLRKNKKITLFNYVIKQFSFSYTFLLGNFFLSKCLIIQATMFLEAFIPKDLVKLIQQYNDFPDKKHMEKSRDVLLVKLGYLKNKVLSNAETVTNLDYAVQKDQYHIVKNLIEYDPIISTNKFGLFPIDYSLPKGSEKIGPTEAPASLSYLTCAYYTFYKDNQPLKREHKSSHTETCSM